MKKKFLSKEEIRKVFACAAATFLSSEDFEKIRCEIDSGWHHYSISEYSEGSCTFFALMKTPFACCVTYCYDTDSVRFCYGDFLSSCFTISASDPIFNEVFEEKKEEEKPEIVEEKPVETSENYDTFSEWYDAVEFAEDLRIAMQFDDYNASKEQNFVKEEER